MGLLCGVGYLYYYRRRKRRRRLLWGKFLASYYMEAGELAWTEERVGGSGRRRRRSEQAEVEGDEGKREEGAQRAAVVLYDIQ